MAPITVPQLVLGSGTPDRMVLRAPDINDDEAKYLAINAVHRARQTMPRVTGATANRLVPLYGEGWFGIYFPDPQAWFMEHGTAPRTMRSLAGKLIPMWVADADGSLRAKNPKIKIRHTEDGRTQVLIFRKAARIGELAWAIQFHPEVSAADALHWIDDYETDADAVRIGVDPTALALETEAKIGTFNQLGRDLFGHVRAASAHDHLDAFRGQRFGRGPAQAGCGRADDRGSAGNAEVHRCFSMS